MKKYFLTKILIFTIFIVHNLQANDLPRFGLSLLALKNKNFPCRKLKTFVQDKNLLIETLYQTFGKSNKCIKRLISWNNDLQFVFYFSNESCRRKKSCFEQEVFYKTENINKRKFIKRFLYFENKIKTFCNKYNVKCYVAPFLEGEYNKRFYKKIINKTSMPLVINEVSKNYYCSKIHCESHNLTNKTADIINLDGVNPYFCNGSLTKTQILNIIKNVNTFVFWCGDWQGLFNLNEGYKINPLNRNFKITRKQLNEIDKIIWRVYNFY